ncbi:MAG TPA: oxalate/formate MFS antiporter [Vicinamibacterales bacterium]|jgi:oxalate/formate antiporter|nr:oxalate/formate MFS antiporter [Vicinamibacterales bacterium]
MTNNRWIQLLLGLLCMVVISSPQYVWTLFTQPLMTTVGATLAQIQITFSILIVIQTFLAPCQGLLVDRFGPRLLLSAGGALTGLSWVLAARATTLAGLYLTYGVLGGIGTGIVYVGVIGHMVQWFPDRRGFATGIVAAGYGMGALLTTFPIAELLKDEGHRPALVRYGVIFIAVGVLAAQGLRAAPAKSRLPTSNSQVGSRIPDPRPRPDWRPAEMLGTPIFWLMFVMMTMMSTAGLMVTSQMAAFTRDFGMANALVFGLPLLPLALSIDRITNGLTRPFFGWLSDQIGRENTMVIAFALEGTAMTLWLFTRSHPALFVIMSGVVLFGWGEIFSLFPSTLTDTFGTRHATTNYGFLYMAQGVGSVLGGPVAALVHDAYGSWMPVFGIIIVMNFATALLAGLVLKPLRQRWLHAGAVSAPAAAPAIRAR